MAAFIYFYVTIRRVAFLLCVYNVQRRAITTIQFGEILEEENIPLSLVKRLPKNMFRRICPARCVYCTYAHTHTQHTEDL